MKITFCIHGCATKPIGGHKVLYECANRLADRGYDITIVFPSYDNLYQLPLPVSCRVLICKVLTDYLHIMPNWFKFDKRIILRTVRDYNERYFPDADVVIASALETAQPVYELPPRCGKKAYLIQDYENWANSDDEVNASYQLGMRNITISNWLKDIVEKHSKDPVWCIPNAIDTETFRIQTKPEKRNLHTVGLLYHSGEHKGLKFAFEALNILKEQYPDLHVEIFGATRPEVNLPNWYSFYYRLNPQELCNLYNRCSVFLCATVEEGFGLTGAESMACGCAFVSTGYKGVYEYAEDEKTALLSPIKDAGKLAANVKRIFEDDSLRLRLAYAGAEEMRKRSWDSFIDELEKAITN